MSAAGLAPQQSTVTLLVVSPDEEDYSSLRDILEQDCQLQRASGREEAASALRQHRPRVVICEETFRDGNWRDLLADLQGQAEAPLLIVCSRLADNRLWAEVLNLGGHDVLTKPFNALEVSRVVRMAARRMSYCGDR
jgi:DNA-binding response OmpR family regulator